ncbi:energy transducer TonB [Flavobacterium gyeonganense]|uniref:Energy transducer TonB n=1 Tax=Flavobacterium gyeonganense TaxID=1310418 RepID=A0ABV5HAX2_9FLAO|nr:energy transducer TonB [Flavobacterium gyeonganense]
MKSILYSLLFLIIPKIVFSQVPQNNELILSPDDSFIYLDSTASETKSKDYMYVRVVKDAKLKKENYIVQEYYRSGSLRMQGISTTYTGTPKEGEVTYYYKNGTKKSVTNYIKGRTNGRSTEWYEDGNKKLEGEYIEDNKKRTTNFKINEFWDKNGVQKVTNGNGFFEDTDENQSSKGAVKNGFKDGNWEGSSLNPRLTYKEKYNEEKLISGESWDRYNVSYKYTETEIRPTPKGGMSSFYQYVGKNYKLPNMPQGTKGKIYVTFVVDKEGKVTEPRIIKDIGYGTGEEALRILNNYDGFNPGEQRGQKMKCLYSLPITIQSAN